MSLEDDYFDSISNAEQNFREFLEENYEAMRRSAGIGDGEGGRLIEILKETLGINRGGSTPPVYRKKAIGRSLKTEIFERDKYRCLRCGAWKGLTVDHIIPESRGGEASLGNLQTLCQPCNSWKGTKTIDFRHQE